MTRLAVVGSGISGLTAAWLLARRHDVVLFERAGRLGGHTQTHRVETSDGHLALDTGFLVHNDRTYPLLVRLFDELGVERIDSDMSFGVSDPVTGFEYGTRSLNGLFADRRNLVRAGHYRLLLEILRFARTGRALVAAGGLEDRTLGEVLVRHGFGGEVVHRFVLPLASAVWSASPASMLDFPAATLLRFFDQHGMLAATGHPTWRTVRGGCDAYVPRLIDAPRLAVRTRAGVTRVHRDRDGIGLELDGAPPERVDQLVLACHGDEVLPLLAAPTPDEREVFAGFRTSENDVWLHTDARWLPRRPAARASWNYRLAPVGSPATVTYHLNRLQRLDARQEYCVTLNPPAPGGIDSDRVLARMTYRHPLYTRAAIAAQARWADVSGLRRTHYCGAYWFYGFHEDGVRSAVRVAEALGVTW